MTNQQKRELGWELMSRAGDIAEFIYEIKKRNEALQDVDDGEIINQLATWMRKIPSKYWDTRLN